MKNNKLIKVTAGFTLGLALLAPTTQESFATSTPSSAVMIAEKRELEDELANAKIKRDTFKEVKNKPRYFNADKAIKNDYDVYYNNFLDLIHKIDKNIEDNKYIDNTQIGMDRDKLDFAVIQLNDRYEKLNGKVVDSTELNILILEETTIKESLEYKSAPQALKDAYDKAIEDGRVSIGKGANLPQEENDRVVRNIKAAKADLFKNYKKQGLIKDLQEEIDKAKKIEEDKDLYSKKSYGVFNAAKIAAITTLENQSSSYEQVESALETLKSAKESLEKVKLTDAEKKAQQIEKLEKAIERNKISVAAARTLLEKYPHTVKDIQKELEQAIKDSEAILAKAEKALNKEKGIRG